MPKKKIRIKSATGSLAWRAVVVSLALLVLPLLIHSLFLYRADDRHNQEDVAAYLDLTASAQKALLDERISLQLNLLRSFSLDQECEFPCFGVQKVTVEPDFPEEFALVSPGDESLFVGRRVEDSIALAIETPLSSLMPMLTEIETQRFPMSLALVDEEGGILAGSKESGDFFTQVRSDKADFFLLLSVPPNIVENLDKTDYVHHFLSLLFLIAAVGGIIVWLVTRRIAKPLRTLCRTMEHVEQGAVHARYQPDRMGFEINALGKQFNQTLDHLLYQQAQAEKERVARERLAEEMRIGHQIQVNLLPKHLPEMKGVDIAQGFLPAREVGGDFYDLFPLSSGKVLIAIADTAGKGISACLYSLGLRSMIRTLAVSGHSLSEIVLKANELFWKDAHASGMFVTLWIGIYDPKTRSLEYCSQGHPAALLIHNGKISELKTEGIALGAQIFDAVSTRTTILTEGALLFLYTDGVIEAHGPDQNMYGASRMREFLLQAASWPVSKIADGLIQEVQTFSQNVPQHDDITMLVMRVINLH